MSCPHCQHCANATVRELLEQVLRKLDHQNERQTVMSNQLDAILDAIDTETTAVAAEFQKLLAEVAAGNANAVTPAQQARADSLVARLTTLASDPQNPVPNPLPAPTPATPPTP